MRLNYYKFPEDFNSEDRFAEGCGIALKIDDTLEGISITHAKELIKKYSGYAWTEHIDRNCSVFEISEITLSGNNSKFKYNHHL